MLKTSTYLVSLQQLVTGKVYAYFEIETTSDYLAKRQVIELVKQESMYTKKWNHICADWCVHAVEV